MTGLTTLILAVATLVAALTGMVAALAALLSSLKNHSRIEEVHILVNSTAQENVRKLDRQEERSEQLSDQLRDAGLIPEPQSPLKSLPGAVESEHDHPP